MDVINFRNTVSQLAELFVTSVSCMGDKPLTGLRSPSLRTRIGSDEACKTGIEQFVSERTCWSADRSCPPPGQLISVSCTR
jgi:hypothetical protein